MTAAADLVKTARLGDVAVLTLNDPATLNAASLAMTEALIAALDAAEQEARAIVITGSGRGFCSGANLSGDLDPDAPDYDAGEPLDTHYNPLMERFRRLSVPVVTAVNGAAAGIGCSIALAGDIVIATESSYFMQAFSRIGLVPDGGSTWLLPRVAGRVRAMEMMLLGEKLSAARALEWGLINRIAPDTGLMDAALAMANRLGLGPTRALGLTRRLAWDALETDFSAQLERERFAQREAGRTADHREGIAAFLQKRPARFIG